MDRAAGILLFLFIPFTLYLFVQEPVSPGGSLLLAVAVMFSHRLVARPWMLSRLSRRCLFCGRSVTPAASEPVPSGDRGGPLVFRACGPACRDGALLFVAFAERWRLLFLAGIGIPLAFHVLTGAAAALGLPLVSRDARLLVFRGVIAATVVSAALLYRTGPLPTGFPRFPFPIHNVFLLGIRWTLAVFLVVGTAWLVQSAFLLAG